MQSLLGIHSFSLFASLSLPFSLSLIIIIIIFKNVEKRKRLGDNGGKRKYTHVTDGTSKCTPRTLPHIIMKKISRNVDCVDLKCLMNV